MAKRPQGGIYGGNPSEGGFAPQENLILTDKLAVALGEKLADVQDQLVNNDYEKKFFEWGDTVKIVAIDPNSVKIEARNFKSSVRPMLGDIEFSMTTMTIDKSLAYGFKIDDLTKIEELWNRESAYTDIAARKMRETHNLLTLDLILANKDIPAIGKDNMGASAHTVVIPRNIFANESTDPASPANELFRIVNAIRMQLERTGATDRDGAYSFGSNGQAELRTSAGLFIGPELKLELLNKQYLRVDDVTEGVIKEGKYEKFGGFILNQANELSTTSEKCCPQLAALRDYLQKHDSSGNTVGTPGTGSVLALGDHLVAIVAGTKNLVTRASRVLPIEKLRSEVERATKYDCMEIYGEMVAVPQAGVVVICKLPAAKVQDVDFGGFYIDGVNGIEDKDATTLMPQYKEQLPFVTVDAAGQALMPQPYASIGRPVGDDDSKKFVDNTGYTQFPATPADIATKTYVDNADAALSERIGRKANALQKINSTEVDLSGEGGNYDITISFDDTDNSIDVTSTPESEQSNDAQGEG